MEPIAHPGLLARVYFRLKPLLPDHLRWAIRRRYARRIREKNRDIWPIDPAANQAPEGWTGWPNGKKFALVLSHDVESAEGLAKVRALAELEMELGFRSSFNFIPEGSYRVPAELRNWLVEQGFEVGVHDLKHDGRLFKSRRGFQDHARAINQYLRDWKAKGFRSGFMLRELGWMQELEVSYDASTFDTDPFEPQPDGSGSIFPFVVSGKRDGKPSSYMELPYTLAQDSTLFLLLEEKTSRIWQEKLDWVVAQGGMALLNAHPDYMTFGEEAHTNCYPVGLYREFLAYVKERYQECGWQALPHEVADHARAMLGNVKPRSRKRVCMATHSCYESDNRVLRYAESLAARGDQVEVLALRRSPQMPKEEFIQGVRVIRILDRFDKSGVSKIGHALQIGRFFRGCEQWMRRNHKIRPYDLLHIHNMPDFVVFSGWYPKWRGARILLDIHDIVPEFYASKFGGTVDGLETKFLLWLEKLSARFSHHVIISNHLWCSRYAGRTGTAGNTSVYINNVDSSVFVANRRRKQDGRLVVIFPGGMQWHQGLDIAIEAFRVVQREVPEAELHLYGDGPMKESLKEQARMAGLADAVKFHDPQSLRDIAAIMADADLGIVPKRADSFGNEAYSTKIMEFMSVGVPVVLSDTKIDRYYFDDSIARFFPSGDAVAMAREVIFLLRHPEERSRQAERGMAYARANGWDSRKHDYFFLVDSLCVTPHESICLEQGLATMSQKEN